MRSLASAAVDGGATAASAAAFARPHACAPRPRCLARRPRDGGAFGGRRPPPAFVSREVLSRGCGSVRCSSVAAPTASSSILPRPSPPLGLLLAVAAVCASAALAVLSPPSLLASAWHSPAAATAKLFLAGSLCACLSHAGATPVDVLKTRMQTEPGRYKGLADAAWRVTAAEGPAALLRGLGPTAAGYATHGALKYGLYEVLKKAAASGPAAAPLSLAALLLCAAAAELVASACLCPFEVARIRMVAAAGGNGGGGGGGGLAAALRSLAAGPGGLAGVLGSLPALYLKMVPYTCAQLATYDALSRWLRLLGGAGAAAAPSPFPAPPPALAALLAASAAAVVASLASQPGDTLLSALSSRRGGGGGGGDDGAGGGGGGREEGVLALAARLGPSGLMAGWGARLAHTGAIVLVQLLIYDAIKAALGLRPGH